MKIFSIWVVFFVLCFLPFDSLAHPGRLKEIKQQARDNVCAKAALEVLIDYNNIWGRGKSGDVIPLSKFAAIHKRTKAMLKECGH